jgi:hypothetical protein
MVVIMVSPSAYEWKTHTSFDRTTQTVADMYMLQGPTLYTMSA